MIRVDVMCENDNREFDISKYANVPRVHTPNHEENFLKRVEDLKKQFQENHKTAS